MIPPVEANGLRQLLPRQSPSRGCQSRALPSRLLRCSQQQPTAGTPGRLRRQSSANASYLSKRSYSSSLSEAYAPPFPSSHDVLGSLFSAVQTQNPKQILDEIGALRNNEHPDDVVRSIATLSTTAFSELVQSMDPIRIGEQVDAAHGLQMPSGLKQFSYVASVDDQNGIRKAYKSIFAIVRSLLDLRLQQGRNLTLSDYLVLLRCAAATSDVESVKKIWKEAMKRKTDENFAESKDDRAYTEFMKARFLTEPLYMQHDLARFRARPRDLFGYRKIFEDGKVTKPLESIRLSIFANQNSSYGRSPSQETHDIHRIISSPRPVKRIWEHMLKNGISLNTEMVSAYMIACGRASSFRRMIEPLWQIWRIRITNLDDHRAAEIIGGIDPQRLDPLLIPTPDLLDAVVQAFGASGHIILAKKLLLFFSERFKVPINPETWSSLLEWTYIASSKPASTEWKAFGDANRAIEEGDVISVWDAMSAELSSETISMRNRDVYVKTLISAENLDAAWEEIRRGRAQYELACEEVETALFERMFPSPPPEAVGNYLRAKAKQHTAWYTMQLWCKLWLHKGSKSHRQADMFASVIVSDFVAEFKDFMPNPITYQTSGGTVRITDPSSFQRNQWTQKIVRSAPTTTRVRDFSQPKFTTVKINGEGQEGSEVKITNDVEGLAEDENMAKVFLTTPSGEQLYDKSTIVLRRWTKRFVRKRTEATFGQPEKKLFAPGDEPVEPSEEVGRRTERRELNKGNVIKSIIW
ncbi:hypothetical protein CMUS01_14803 [Colletotrichum musicola]|uniref:Pentatricopeptide repeat domain-containing protein n=1 Tax=Colletotrichum musicola TaxID=2175873 RepID=A0A8H6J1D2_9PEZI|nr:hypothetical protein CMUS01_14803 [Colletotrichum musicola]